MTTPTDLWARTLDRLTTQKRWEPLPHQVPPPGSWRLWLLLAGRGAGKTDACADYVTRHVAGPPCDHRAPGGHRIGIIAPTLGDAVESCVNGVSGLKAHDPSVRLLQAPGGTVVRWPGGAEAKLFGTHTDSDVDRLRAGGNRCLNWYEELAAWPLLQAGLDQARFGLRVGPHPHAIGSTTPKNRKALRELVAEATADGPTRITHATTDDNPHLNPEIRAELYARYADTALGAQELLGKMLAAVEGALWVPDQLEAVRVPRERMPGVDLVRVVIGVDPEGESSSERDTETGIVVAGRDANGICYVLDDASLRATPAGWARAVVEAFDRNRADRVVAERNNGGEMVLHTLHTARAGLNATTVWASRGKRTRAEPIAALYGDPARADTWHRAKVRHVGRFAQLEEQMTSWVPGSDSPDRLDALVWALTDLNPGLGGGITHTSRYRSRGLARRR